MGLAEQRAAKEFETSRYPMLKAQVDKAAGFEVPLTVRWDTLAIDGSAHLYDTAWEKVYFQPLIGALESVCRDDLGRDAVKEGVKGFVIQSTADIYYGDQWAKFDTGTMTLDHLPTTNIDNVKERTDGLIKVLEAAL